VWAAWETSFLFRASSWAAEIEIETDKKPCRGMAFQSCARLTHGSSLLWGLLLEQSREIVDGILPARNVFAIKSAL